MESRAAHTHPKYTQVPPPPGGELEPIRGHVWMCRSSFDENYLLIFEGKSLSLFNINQVSISVWKYLYFCGSAAALLTTIFIVNITLINSHKNSFIQILKITLRAGFQYFVSGCFYTEDALSSLRSRRLEVVGKHEIYSQLCGYRAVTKSKH